MARALEATRRLAERNPAAEMRALLRYREEVSASVGDEQLALGDMRRDIGGEVCWTAERERTSRSRCGHTCRPPLTSMVRSRGEAVDRASNEFERPARRRTLCEHSIVYESVYGNTRTVANGIEEGLRPRFDVTVLRVAAVTPDMVDSVEVLFVGGPTHTRGVSDDARASLVHRPIAAASSMPDSRVKSRARRIKSTESTRAAATGTAVIAVRTFQRRPTVRR